MVLVGGSSRITDHLAEAAMAGPAGQAKDPQAAVLGTGIIGSAMVRNLAAAGLPTTVWDR